MKDNSNQNSTQRSQWTPQHSSGPKNSSDQGGAVQEVSKNQLCSDSYRGTSRDKVYLAGDESSPDYDYQDHESYQVPTRNSERGYAPIEQQESQEK